MVKDVVDNGVDTHIAAPGGNCSDRQGEPNADPVRSEGNVREVPKKGPSWASIVDAKPDDEGFSNIADADGVQPVAVDGDNDAGWPKFAGKVSHVSADGTVIAGDAVRVILEIAGAKEHAKRRYKVS